MRAVLVPDDFFLSCSQIVVQQSDSGGRADLIAERSPRDGHRTADPPAVKNRVVISQCGDIFRTPSAESSDLFCAEIATPRDVCDHLSDRRIERSGPDGLHSPPDFRRKRSDRVRSIAEGSARTEGRASRAGPCRRNTPFPDRRSGWDQRRNFFHWNMFCRRNCCSTTGLFRGRTHAH